MTKQRDLPIVHYVRHPPEVPADGETGHQGKEKISESARPVDLGEKRRRRSQGRWNAHAHAAWKNELGHRLPAIDRINEAWGKLTTLAYDFAMNHNGKPPHFCWVGEAEQAAMDAFIVDAIRLVGNNCPAIDLPHRCRWVRAEMQGASLQAFTSNVDGSDAKADIAPDFADVWPGAVRGEVDELHADDYALISGLAVAFEYRSNPVLARVVISTLVEWMAAWRADPKNALRHFVSLIPPEGVALRILRASKTPKKSTVRTQNVAELQRELQRIRAANPHQKEAKNLAHIADVQGVTVRTLRRWLARK